MEDVVHETQTGSMSKRIADIAISTRAWLAAIAEDLPACGNAAVRAPCYVLISYWITEAMVGSYVPYSLEFSKVAHCVSRPLNAPENWEHMVSVNPTLRLLTEVLLSSQGLTAEPFRQFLAQSVSVLRQRDPTLEADVSFMDKRILLHCAGVLPTPSSRSYDNVRQYLDNFQLSASAQEIDFLSLQLEYSTGWGTRVVEPEIIKPWVGEMLAGFAVQRLREYDLIPAARLLRLLEYFASCRLVSRRDDLYRYLCDQHRMHGPFGWYGPEVVELHKRSPASSEDVEFYLPTTLECLWTLAERYTDGWRLFDRVPPYVRPGVEGL